MEHKVQDEEVNKYGLTGTIYYDSDAQSPRKWDNLGIMVLSHRRYNLGDDYDKHGVKTEWFDSWQEVEDFLYDRKFSDEEGDESVYDKAVIALPVYMYDHSGITISVNKFSCPWDSGQIGFIYATREDILKAFKRQRLSKKLLKKVKQILIDEVETYDKYLTGQVYGYVVSSEEDEHLDSCWGYYDLEHCRDEMISTMKYHKEKQEEDKINSIREKHNIELLIA